METFEEGSHQEGKSLCSTKQVFFLVTGPDTHLGTRIKGK